MGYIYIYKNNVKMNIRERIPATHTGFTTLLSLESGSWLGFGRSKKLAQHHAASVCLKERQGVTVDVPVGAGASETYNSQVGGPGVHVQSGMSGPTVKRYTIFLQGLKRKEAKRLRV